MSSFYEEHELKSMGFKFIGKNVKVSRKASIYNAAKISIGDFSRIDDFCVLSAGDGEFLIGKNVHIAVYSSLIGNGPITLSDFCNISSRVAIYTSNDDYSGEFMTNPTVPPKYTNVTCGTVYLEKHVLVGSGSIILPNTRLSEGACVGALSLVTSDCEEFKIYAGVPARFIKDRKRGLLQLEEQYTRSLENIKG